MEQADKIWMDGQIINWNDAHVHLIWAGAEPNPEEIRARESVPMATVRAVRHAAEAMK